MKDIPGRDRRKNSNEAERGKGKREGGARCYTVAQITGRGPGILGIGGGGTRPYGSNQRMAYEKNRCEDEIKTAAAPARK